MSEPSVNKELYRYRAYSLGVDSVLPLPELTVREACSNPANIQICLGKVAPYPRHIDETGRAFWVREDQAYYYLHGIGAFLVSAGQHILVEPYPDSTQASLRLPVLGPALALALHQRGLFILHASAVSIEGAAVAFLGGHGWGKSTMAGLLQARGYPVISDDLTALEQNNNTVVPSYPQLKLWPDAIHALGLSLHELPQVHPCIEKRALRFTQNFASRPLPLRRLYVLGIGQSISIEMLRPTQALEEIMCHWYGARFGPAFFNFLDLREHFLQVSRLVRDVPIRYLRRPTTLLNDPSLPGTIERAILQDLGSV